MVLGPTQMNIKEFSKISGISAHTLRYYEKIGIFQEINRNDSGHRDFSENDILWAEFINRLKETGMPLGQIKKYAVLRKEGEHTASARMKLLINHATALKKKISDEKQHLKKICEKIVYYEKILINEIPLDLE
jgi:DNA-binding transcriptional MerR regulator